MHENSSKSSLEAEAKRDINDFFLEEGEAAPRLFLELLDKAPLFESVLISELPEATDPSFGVKLDDVIIAAARKPEPAREHIFELIRAARKTVSKAFLAKRLAAILRDWAAKSEGATGVDAASARGNRAAGSDLRISPDRPRKDILDSVVKSLAETDLYFSYQGALAKIDAKKVVLITTAAALQYFLCEVRECLLGKSKADDEFTLLPRDLAEALIRSDFSQGLSEVTLHTDLPVLDKDFIPVAPGYNPASKIYYAGDLFTPAVSLNALEELLSEFDFQDHETDRSNFVGAMLTSLVHHLFKGKVPMLVISANQRGVGKSILAQVLAIVRQGLHAKTLTFNPDDVELEKRLCSTLRSSPSVTIIDNVKALKGGGEISSSVLERMITDPRISFRILGHSRDLDMENTVQVVLTTNGGRMSPDLISRKYEVRLFREGNPSKRQFKNREITHLALARRKEVVAELLGMFELWRAKGMPMASIDHRFRSWAELIGGVLEANGFKGFLAASANDDEQDQDLAAFKELAALVEVGRIVTADQLHKRAGGKFAKEREVGASSKGANIAFGKLLPRFVGDQFTCANGSTATFERAGKNSDKVALYTFRSTGISGDQATSSGDNLRRMNSSHLG